MFYGSYVGFGGGAAAADYAPAGACWFDGSNDELSHTFTAAGTEETFTISCWIKRMSFGTNQTIFGGVTSNKGYLRFDTNDRLEFMNELTSGARNNHRITNAEYTDPTNWMHVVVQNDSTQGSAADRVKIWVNGEAISSFYGTANLNQNEIGLFNTATIHYFGRKATAADFFNGMLADFIFIDGNAYEASNFGQTDALTGIWVPKNPATSGHSFGTNGFWLDFSDPQNIGKNAAGNTHTSMTIYNLTAYDSDGGGNFEAHHNLQDNASADDNFIAQSFVSKTTEPITHVRLKTGSYVANTISVRLETDNGSGAPSGTLAATNTTKTGISTSTSSFTSLIALDASLTPVVGTTYWLVITATSGGTSIAMDTSGFQDFYVKGRTYRDHDDQWDATFNVYFELYQNSTSMWNGDNMGTVNIIPDSPADMPLKEFTHYSSLDPSTLVGGTLNNNNLTYDVGGGSNYALGNIAKSSGKYYWETVIGATGFTVGIAEQTEFALSNGSGTKTVVFSASDGTYGQSRIYSTGSFTDYATNGTTRPAANSVMQCKLNLDDNEITFGNNNNWGTALSFSAGTYKPSFARNTTSDFGTVIFKESEWHYTPPTGYGEIKETITGVSNFPNISTISGYAGGAGTGTANGVGSHANMKWVPAADEKTIGLHQFDAGDSDGFYWEVQIRDQTAGTQTGVGVGVAAPNSITAGNTTSFINDGNDAKPRSYYWIANSSEYYRFNHTVLSSQSDLADGDIFGYFIKGGSSWVHINGTYQNSGNPNTGTNAMDTTITGSVIPYFYFGGSQRSAIIANFGQRPFAYTPPTGAKKLATMNYTAPTYTTPTDYFDTTIYTGNGTAIGSGGLSITAFSFQPDFVWIKNTEQTDDHRIFDSIRGAQNYLESNSANAQNQVNDRGGVDYPDGGYAEMLNAFTSTGFNLGDNVSVNTNNEKYVAFAWKAGGAPTATNTSGTGGIPGQTPTSGAHMRGGSAITSAFASAGIYPKKISVAAHRGFSMVQVTLGGSAVTIPHGLDKAPFMIIGKRIDDGTGGWIVYHDGMDSPVSHHQPGTHSTSDNGPEDYYLRLDLQDARVDDATQWNDTAPTADVFSVGTGGAMNTDGATVMYYCFARVPGLIGGGAYAGNGNADGPEVHIDDGAFGFKPAWLMYRTTETSSRDWHIVNNKSTPFNPADGEELNPNDNSAYGGGMQMNLLSNGFKITNSSENVNKNNDRFVYMAFAETAASYNMRASSGAGTPGT